MNRYCAMQPKPVPPAFFGITGNINATLSQISFEYSVTEYDFANAVNPAFVDWLQFKKVFLETLKGGMDEIADGGAAFAYQKLQFPDLSAPERDAINNGLLRYCEPDTLAMVMIYECFREVCDL